jgi:hypothetical protein
MSTSSAAAVVVRRSQALDQLVPPKEPELRRTVQAWFTSLLRRVFPDAILPEGVNLIKEAPVLEETLVKWRNGIRKEALQEGRILTLRKVLLQQLTLRLADYPRRSEAKLSRSRQLRSWRSSRGRCCQRGLSRRWGSGRGAPRSPSSQCAWTAAGWLLARRSLDQAVTREALAYSASWAALPSRTRRRRPWSRRRRRVIETARASTGRFSLSR